VRRLDAAFFLSALGKGKRKKAASSRRTPKGRWGYKFPFLVNNLLRKYIKPRKPPLWRAEQRKLPGKGGSRGRFTRPLTGLGSPGLFGALEEARSSRRMGRLLIHALDDAVLACQVVPTAVTKRCFVGGCLRFVLMPTQEKKRIRFILLARLTGVPFL